MALVGYARVSSIDQDFALQVDALKKAGCKKVFAEKKVAHQKMIGKLFMNAWNTFEKEIF